jgi:DNA-binding XRE family transcriptional regulator
MIEIRNRDLRRLREKFKITRRQIADLTGISEPTIVRYEKGKSKPHFFVKKKLMLITSFLKEKENE